jgi:hypothetical protein
MIENINRTEINKKKHDEYLYQFLTQDFSFLLKDKKLEYKGHQLKTDYLINIIHDIILRYYFTNEVVFDYWSLILRSKYGKTYNIYIDYLIEKEFISMVSNYFVGKKTKTYKVNNIEEKEIIRCKINDKIILKKHSKEFLMKNFINYNSSPIDVKLRYILVDDLYHVNIMYKEASEYLENSYNNGLEKSKYLKNLNSIDSIERNNIFFKFDEYGRLHTNYTILKKEIRHNYLNIDGEDIEEIDIKNSQPFFFAQLLKNEIGIDNFNNECNRFLELVNNGLIYDDLCEKLSLKDRDEAKKMMYRVLFGGNKDKCVENISFNKIYPTIFTYLIEIKDNDGHYSKMSHNLQRMESNFIFGKVVSNIKERYPYVKLFTVHDSICYPKIYSNEVKLIFNNELKKLK